jgi:hypothetical protein
MLQNCYINFKDACVFLTMVPIVMFSARRKHISAGGETALVTSYTEQASDSAAGLSLTTRFISRSDNMSEKTRKKCRCLLMGACIALGIYFGAYRLGLIPLFNLLYCRQYGMLTMLHAIECILCISAAVIITASSGLLGLAISWLFGFDSEVRRHISKRHTHMNSHGQAHPHAGIA